MVEASKPVRTFIMQLTCQRCFPGGILRSTLAAKYDIQNAVNVSIDYMVSYGDKAWLTSAEHIEYMLKYSARAYEST